VSGTAGTGKSSLAAHLCDAACRRGERVLYFAFEESPKQIMRNLGSIGIDLEQWAQKGLLQFHANRPTFAGLETHLTTMHKTIEAFKPHVVILDPVNSFVAGDNLTEVKILLMRLVDFLKVKQITGFFTSLTSGGGALTQTDVAISSLIDTWLLLSDIELGGERNRGLYVLKSRGMAHSNQIREFLLTDHGVDLRDVYLGASGVLTGSARLAEEDREAAVRLARQQEIERRELGVERKRRVLEAQIATMRAELEAQEAETLGIIQQEQAQQAQLAEARVQMGRSRKENAATNKAKRGSKWRRTQPSRGRLRGNLQTQRRAGIFCAYTSPGKRPNRSWPLPISKGSARSTWRGSTRFK
jgi:circadian clock protein KaiC